MPITRSVDGAERTTGERMVPYAFHMPSPPASLRAMAAWRRACPWILGAGVVALRARSIELVPPHRCAGLLELVAVATVAARPALTLGHLFGTLHGVAVVAAVSLFIQLAARATRDLRTASAAGIAVGLGPLFPVTLAPPWEATAFAASAAGGLLISSLAGRHVGNATRIVCAAIPAVFALVVPPATVFAALVSAAIVSIASPHREGARRYLPGLGSAAAIIGLVAAVQTASPPDALTAAPSWHAGLSCMLPAQTGASLSPMQTFAEIQRLVGPLVLALPALGLFAQVRPLQGLPMTAAIVLVCLALPMAGTAAAPIALAPALVGIWWLAVSGLRETGAILAARGENPAAFDGPFDSLALSLSKGELAQDVRGIPARPGATPDFHHGLPGRGFWPRVVGTLLLVLMPALQAGRRDAEERDDRVRPQGHATATLRQVRALL